MAPNQSIQNVDLMKDYVQGLLAAHGHELEARRLDGVTIRCAGTASSVACILDQMKLPPTAPPVLKKAKQDLLSRLTEVQQAV